MLKRTITFPKARAHGEGCPYCAGKKILTGFNDLKSQYPELAEEWSDKNELHSDMVTTGSSKKVWWKCHICGYEWRAVIKNRVGGSGCPNCVNRILIKGKNHILYSAGTDGKFLQPEAYGK